MPMRAPILKPCGHATVGRCLQCRSPRSLRGRAYSGITYNTTAWRTLRAQVLREEPLCRCEIHRDDNAPFGSKPDAPASDTVDHIKAHRGDKDLFFARSNLRGMARDCHNAKTSRDDSWNRGVS